MWRLFEEAFVMASYQHGTRVSGLDGYIAFFLAHSVSSSLARRGWRGCRRVLFGVLPFPSGFLGGRFASVAFFSGAFTNSSYRRKTRISRSVGNFLPRTYSIASPPSRPLHIQNNCNVHNHSKDYPHKQLLSLDFPLYKQYSEHYQHH